MKLAAVVLDIPTKSLAGSYTYIVPDTSEFANIEIGCAVKVPFGPRTAVGFVVDVFDGEDFEGAKPLAAMLSGAYFNTFAVECAKFLAERYVAPLSTCIRLFVPPGSLPKMKRASDGRWQLSDPSIAAIDDRWVVAGENIDEFEPRKNAVKQIAVLEAVRLGDVKVTELSAIFGTMTSVLNTLEKAGAIRIEHRRKIRGALDDDSAISSSNLSYAVTEMPKELTPCQVDALRKIDDAYDSHDGRVVLIDGVTGSGKTEVYLQAISKALQEKKGAIMLVPEIALTPQTVARFHARFGSTVAVLHSRMSQGERFDQLEMIRAGHAQVVVGARSALFAPLSNLGLVIIDEEHESTYKQESTPRYVTRDVAAWMVKKCGGTLILGSATPSIESLYRAHTCENWSVAEMPHRANGRAMPPIEVVDMTQVKGEIFSERLSTQIVNELKAGNKVVLLLNQRGFAQYMLCQECGFVARCVSCSTTLTYHARSNDLMCHHCGYTAPAPSVCPECKSPYLMKRGVGTQRVEEELRSLLDGAFGVEPEVVPIVRMDADTTSKKGAHAKLLSDFAAAPRAVLLGTQMIAKGLDFDEVTLVGVVNADTQLHLPDFRASERTFDLIEQVAGRAGRGEQLGRVMVQTHEPDNVAIRAAASYDRDLFLRSELPKRKVLKYPPYVRMANIVFWGKSESTVESQAKVFWDKCVAEIGDEDVQILVPTPCVFERIRSDFRWHIVIKCPCTYDISKALTNVYLSVKKNKDVSIAVDVDPVDLL